ncbi:MAG TPA: hypothetical protein VFU49_22680 [Ktedonobacteraceae bacterium]|nr:hypothetical protein [Ktedonobacteraceae bacterium]
MADNSLSPTRASARPHPNHAASPCPYQRSPAIAKTHPNGMLTGRWRR